MVRVMAGIAAWVAGTAIAVCVAWLGANVVVRDAGVQSGLPVVNAAVVPPSASPLPSSALGPAASVTRPAVPSGTGPASGAGQSGSASAHGTPVAGKSSPPASPTVSASASSTAGVHAYTLTGGRVTLDVTSSVQLVTAVPDAGYSVQTWSGTGWLRVDFSSGPNVSSLIASWYQHAPAITVTNG
jgi:hypothetical protein